MKKSLLLLLVLVIIAAMCMTMVSCKSATFASQKISYSSTYSEIKLGNNNTKWRDGMVGGNGKTGFITNGSPKSDVITYQNIDYIMPTSANRDDFSTGGATLDEIRQKIINFEEPQPADVINQWGRIAKYHPGMQIRIDTNYTNKDVSGYQRSTNYETAEVGETYSDGSVKWDRKTFTSREDDVTITSISNSSKDVSLTISIDTISKMDGFGRGGDSGQTDETNIQYKEIVSDDAEYLAQVVHYPDYEYSSYRTGGYGAVSLIIIDGGSKTAKKTSTSDSYNKNGYDASVEIKNAKNVYIITALDKTKTMGEMADFADANEYELITSLLTKTRTVSTKYTSDGFSYDKALAPSKALQSALFNAASVEVVDTKDSQASLSNEDLIAAQGKASSLSSTLMNRVYNQGRYAMICCAGYSMSRLSGMWIGTWDPGWRYIYTMDANVNLQTSGINTSNLSTFGEGYINFVYNQLEDWETNAKVIYGIDDALLCPPHADGDRAINDEGNIESQKGDIGYPFQYWNAGAAWVIQPIYEFYTCYGDRKVTTVDGEKELLKDILLPMLQKNANFWLGLCTPKYYTDKNGNAKYGPEKIALEEGEKYCIIPSYSPENRTSGDYQSTLAVNCAMDIAAAKYSLQMAIELENLVKVDSQYTTRVQKYTDLLNNLPEYQYDSTGAIKEYCANGYNDTNNHRHISHLYVAWPAFETQTNSKLEKATAQALVNRNEGVTSGQDKQSHFWLHKGLVYARLGDAKNVTNVLFNMLATRDIKGTGLLYNSLMTNHDVTGGSNAYCTDSSLGLVGVMNEALLYSNGKDIELLPACPTTFEKGKFTNLRTRNRANVTCEWTKKKVKCTIVSDINQTLNITCRGKTKTVTVEAGTAKTVKF